MKLQDFKGQKLIFLILFYQQEYVNIGCIPQGTNCSTKMGRGTDALNTKTRGKGG